MAAFVALDPVSERPLRDPCGLCRLVEEGTRANEGKDLLRHLVGERITSGRPASSLLLAGFIYRLVMGGLIGQRHLLVVG